MRTLKIGQVWCINGSKKFEVTIIFLTAKNVLFSELDGEESLMDRDTFMEEHTFLKNIRL